MLFSLEAMAFCLVFTALVAASVLKNPLNWISDYPPAIQKRAMELGLVPKDKKRITPAELTRKAVGSLLIVALLSLLLTYVNGLETFRQGFFWSYGLYGVVALYDALVVDIAWFCHSKRVILPGTEDMVESYHDYWFHIRMSLIGMVLGLPICLLVGLGVTILS